MSPQASSNITEFIRDRILQRLKDLDGPLHNDQNLAQLGLRSIDVVLISGEIEDHFQIEVDPIMMFEHDTVSEVAHHVSQLIDAQHAKHAHDSPSHDSPSDDRPLRESQPVEAK